MTDNQEMDSKMVIFIGGTSYSGTTLLDMILANDPAGLSLGEIYALFRPHKRHHVSERRKLRKDSKWGPILKGGEKNLYRNLFNTYPHIDFFVDSSKEVFWMKKQQRILKRQGIPFRNVLIHKSPAEVAASYGKRGAFGRWATSYVKYHREYFRLFRIFHSISYKKLVTVPGDLHKLCAKLKIDYFPGKEKYWEKSHHPFFGNERARAHLRDYADKGGSEVGDLTREGKQRLYYNPPADSVRADIRSQNLPLVWQIHSILDGKKENPDFPSASLVLPGLRNFLARNIKKMFFGIFSI